MIDLRLGDCLEILKTLPDNSVDSVVVDPPYGLGFLNKEWDSPKKHKELIDRETKRSQERFDDGKSPVKGGFSKGVQPGLAIGGAKEGRWFQEWCELWGAECLRVLKPGGYILSFSAPRTYHRMATAFEETGFQVRDQIMWIFGSGFPKSHNIGKAIQKQSGDVKVVGKKTGMGTTGNSYVSNNEEYIGGDKGVYKKEYDDIEINNDYEGWGTALKPAHEPICMARKPLSEKSIAENVLRWGTGGINIDESRIASEVRTTPIHSDDIKDDTTMFGLHKTIQHERVETTEGRFPANIMFDEEAGKLLDEQSGERGNRWKKNYGKEDYEGLQYSSSTQQCVFGGGYSGNNTYADKGGASRFFYSAKVSKKERGDGNVHPTVKPIAVMEYLIKMVTPKGGVVLDCFMGSGSTGIAAKNLGFDFIGIEKEEEYMEIAKQRIG
jgi:site-specific DNA-methyltransferase (adenine-specific)